VRAKVRRATTCNTRAVNIEIDFHRGQLAVARQAGAMRVRDGWRLVSDHVLARS